MLAWLVLLPALAQTETAADFQASLDGMSQEAINLKWQEFMGPYFEALGDARPDQTMIELEEVFHTD